MSVIMNRNKNGKVKIGNDIATIPIGESALNVFSQNSIVNNSVYKIDGWVYVNNKQVKKWMSRCNQITIWHPKFDDLDYLYKLYCKTSSIYMVQLDKIDGILSEIWSLKKSNAKEAIAHCCPTHKYSGAQNKWWAYNIDISENGCFRYTFTWLDKQPEKLENSKLGQKLYDLAERAKDLGKRNFKVSTIFLEGIKKSLPPAKDSEIICVRFKYDKYFFHAVENQWALMDNIKTLKEIKY